jgi:hypothetical protein
MREKLKHIDFTTTGRYPSAEEFRQISEWINAQKRADLLAIKDLRKHTS